MKFGKLGALALSLGVAFAGLGHAEPFDDGMSASFYAALKGKKVIYVPISMGMDIAAGFGSGLQRMADDRGFTIEVRDPNWSVDQGVQAITQAISENPDLIVVQNVDMQAYARVLQQANDAGVRVLQVNVKATTNTTGHVGIDWYEMGHINAGKLVEKCSPKNGGNGKIAVLEGTPNNPTNFIGMLAFQDVMAANPEMQVVADQAADWDASKAHTVTGTILQQNPDLCGLFGFWDGQDSGAVAAIKEAGMQDSVFLVSQGAAESASCAMIADGSYDFYVSYNIRELSKHINDAVAVILQTPAGEAIRPFGIYVRPQQLTKDTIKPDSCWKIDDIKNAN